MKAKLREKLGDIKNKVRGTGGEVEEIDVPEEKEAPEVVVESPKSPSYAPSIQPEEAMTAGVALVAHGPELGKPVARKKKEKPQELALRGSGSRSLSGQLIQRALVATKARKKASKKKKGKKGKKDQVVKLLSQILTGKSAKNDKKEKKKKKRRTLKDGAI